MLLKINYICYFLIFQLYHHFHETCMWTPNDALDKTFRRIAGCRIVQASWLTTGNPGMQAIGRWATGLGKSRQV